ncbi:MAG TPA: F0F1 ATP synthase subunit B [Chloroflexota bacterium]
MLGPVSISIPTLVVELVIFLATVWLMQTLVFEPIRIAHEEREKAIQEGLAASSNSQEEAQRGAEEVREVYAEARRQAQAEVDAAAARGNTVREELVAQASAEFRRLLDAARAEIGQDREQAAERLRGRIVEISILAATKVTGQTYDQPRVRELAAAVVAREGLR